MSIFLNAGLLKSSSGCTIGDYRIDWRLGSSDGEVLFISGLGADGELQAQHPLVNEVVSNGNLYPVVNYAYINGVKVTSAYELGVIFSPDMKDCLPSVLIDEINCSTLYTENDIFNFNLSYNSTTSVNQNKSRTLSYKFGASTQYVAFKFDAHQIADGIKFYYCTALDSAGVLIDNYITGSLSSNGVNLITDKTPVDYPNNPKILSEPTTLGYTPLQHLVDLSPFTYVAGDYLKVEIIGSVLDPTNNNTNWNLSLGCLDSFDNATFQGADISRIDLSVDPTMRFDELGENPICTYWTTYKTIEAAEDPAKVTSNDILKYLSMATYWTSDTSGGKSGQYTMGGDIGEIENKYLIQHWVTWYETAGNCQDLPNSETMLIESTNNNLLITFSNITEYNKEVAKITAIQNNAIFIAAQIADPTTKEYYSGYWFEFVEAVSCGDSQIIKRTYIHNTSVITYDAGLRTINFTMPTITNQIPGSSSCITPYDAVQQYVNSVNNDSAEVQTFSTGITAVNGVICGSNIFASDETNVVVVQKRLYRITTELYDNLISPAEFTALGFFIENDLWVKYKQYDRVTFTDISSNEKRLENWTLERQKILRTGVLTDIIQESNYELVYTSVSPALKGIATVSGTLTNAI